MNKPDRFAVYCMYCTIIRLLAIIAVAIQRYTKDEILYIDITKFQTDEQSTFDRLEGWADE